MRSFGIQRFGEYAADQPDFSTQHMEAAHNCIPRATGYEPLAQTEAFTDALPERAVGAASYRSSLETSHTLAGTLSALWETQSASWNNISRVSPAYSATERWEFAKWGDDVYAASRDNQLQKIALGGPNFADVAGVNLQAAHIAVVRNQLMVANVLDDDGLTPNRARWSAINNPDDWLPSQSTLAGFTQLESTQSGKIVRIIGGEFAILFGERDIWRASFTGAAASAFQFDNVEKGARVFNSGSIVEHAGSVYYLSEDGFRVTRGGASAAIGEERIDTTVLSDLNTTYLDRITSVVMTDDQVIMWAYPGADAVDGQCNRLVMFNVGANRWSTGEEAVWQLTQARLPETSLDSIDNFFDSIDDVPGSLDDKAWSGGGLETAVINSDGIARLFTGPPRTAVFETAEMQHAPGRRVFVSEVRPIVSGEDVQIAIGFRDNQGTPVQYTVATSQNDIGVVETRVNSRYLRYRVTVNPPWENAVGLEPFGEQTGGR